VVNERRLFLLDLRITDSAFEAEAFCPSCGHVEIASVNHDVGMTHSAEIILGMLSIGLNDAKHSCIPEQ
jgi:hypothetical protein